MCWGWGAAERLDWCAGDRGSMRDVRGREVGDGGGLNWAVFFVVLLFCLGYKLGWNLVVYVLGRRFGQVMVSMGWFWSEQEFLVCFGSCWEWFFEVRTGGN